MASCDSEYLFNIFDSCTCFLESHPDKWVYSTRPLSHTRTNRYTLLSFFYNTHHVESQWELRFIDVIFGTLCRATGGQRTSLNPFTGYWYSIH